MKLKIMDYTVEFCVEAKWLRGILSKELEMYPTSGLEPNFYIYVVDEIKKEGYYSNSPSIHRTYNDGFLAYFGGNKVLYEKSDKIRVFIELKQSKSFIRKFMNMGYRYNHENIGQFLHELVLVPLNFFKKNRSIIHASTMKHLDNGRCIMIGGTGGVGKTSLELSLCRDHGYSFISDDIAILDRERNVYPNLSHPKIYAYNVRGNKQLERDIFKRRGFIDRLQWNTLRRLRGDDKVRRALSPKELYKSYENNSCKADDYYVISRSSDVDEVTFKKISPETAAYISRDIIVNEYHSFFQHVRWHEYNCAIMGFQPILAVHEIFSEFEAVYSNFFKDVNCYSVKVPVDHSHKRFLSDMAEFFRNEE